MSLLANASHMVAVKTPGPVPKNGCSWRPEVSVSIGKVENTPWVLDVDPGVQDC
jgi:hypothetical protein